MERLNVRYVLEETSKSVTNGHTVETLENWKKLLKEQYCKEDKKSLKNAIAILEEVIRLKKIKNKTGKEKFKQAFLFLLFTFMLVSVYASINYNVGGENRFIVDENISTFVGDVNITNHSIKSIHALDFNKGSQIIEEDSIIISTGNNQTIRGIFGVDPNFPEAVVQQMAFSELPLGLDNKTIAFLGSVKNFDDIDGFSRFEEVNLNNGTSAVSGFLARNDLGKTLTIGITSSNFILPNDTSLESVPTIFSNTSSTFAFVNLFKTGWRFRVNEANSSTSFDFTDVLIINDNGNLTITGNLTSDQIQLRSVEPKHPCNNEAKGTIVYEGNGTSGDFFGCTQLNAISFIWKKL